MAATKEDIQRIVDEATKGGSKPRRMIRVTGTLKMPGKVQYAMRHLSFTVEEELPADRKRSDVVREICDDLAPLVLEYESKAPAVRDTVPQPQSQGWDGLPWRQGPYGEWIFADEEKAKPLLSMILATPGGKLTLGDWTYNVSKGKQDGREFINRARKK